MLVTCLSSVQQTASGRWSVSFDTLAGAPGNQHKMSSCESAAVFDNEDAAYAGGTRALDVLLATGEFPNLCELF